MTTGAGEVIDEARSLIARARRLTDSYERPDLAERLDGAGAKLDDPELRIVVVGEFKQGKSTLVNALLGHPLCPVDDDVATCVPTVIRHGDPATATVVYEGEDGEGETEAVDIEDLSEFVSEQGNRENEKRILRVDVGLPHPLLERGVTIVDTPGVGGLGSVHSSLTLGVLPTADAVILVSDVSQEYSDPEIDFLRRAVDACPNVLCVLTKTDLYPAWRKVVALDREHLEARGFDAELIPVSSELHRLAGELDDDELREESGFPALTRYLEERVVVNAEHLAARSVANDVVWAVSQLRSVPASELEALQDDADREGLLDRLEQARASAGELLSATSRWQLTLDEGVDELRSEVEHEMERALRSLVREAHAALDETDPAEAWDEFQAWLEQRVSVEIADRYSYLNRRAGELAEDVAERFHDTEAQLSGHLDAEAPVDIVQESAATRLGLVEDPRVGMVRVLEGSWGGFEMFAFLGQTAGLGALSPVLIAAGLLMGRRVYKNEKERRLKERRQEAKQAVREYVDDVSFSVRKRVGDAVRRLRRSLREALVAHAEGLRRSTDGAFEAAIRAGAVDPAERTAHIERLGEALSAVDAIRADAEAVVQRGVG